MRSSDRLREMEMLLKALANRRRLLMLATLARREVHVGALAEEIRLPLKTVSRNLRLLERTGLVVSEPRGGRVFYRLNDTLPYPAGSVLAVIGSSSRPAR